MGLCGEVPDVHPSAGAGKPIPGCCRIVPGFPPAFWIEEGGLDYPDVLSFEGENRLLAHSKPSNKSQCWLTVK